MKKALILTVFYFISSAVQAQEKSLLWEVTNSAQNVKPSYLYGTMHIADKKIFHISDSALAAFQKCKVFAGEIIIDKGSRNKIAKLMFMPGDTTLEMFLGDSGYRKVKKCVRKKSGIMAAALANRLKPIITLGLLAEKEFRRDKSMTLDEFFQRRAIKNNMKLVGLESIEEQMGALDHISLRRQAMMLLEEVEYPATGKGDEAEEMLNVYLHQDITVLEKYAHEEGVPEEFTQDILLNRNYLMTDRIEKIISEQPSFIAIGAAHLAGKEGLIALLIAKGFKVRPIIAPFKN
jgi:uncharacterized protein YbaP (TraB family)